jgi:hypothetical protein
VLLDALYSSELGPLLEGSAPLHIIAMCRMVDSAGWWTVRRSGGGRFQDAARELKETLYFAYVICTTRTAVRLNV